MKTLVGIPCMDKVDTLFMVSLLGMHRVGQTHVDIKKGSMIFDSRNQIAVDAIKNDADRVLMIDSDMRFDPDMMERMSERMDQGCDMVCGLFFKRSNPTSPVIYKELEPPESKQDKVTQHITAYTDYPKDSLFRVEGCGFGAVMMTTELAKAVWETYKEPAFHPYQWCGEDMAFCYKIRQMGRKSLLNSGVPLGVEV